MRTRKLLVSLVVCYLYLMQFSNCQEEGFHESGGHAKLLARHRVNNYKNKNHDSEFMERLRGFDAEEDKNHARFKEDTYEQASNDFAYEDEDSLVYRNRRAIDAPGTSDGNSGKSGHNQSTPSNLPNPSIKPTEQGQEPRYKPDDEDRRSGICKNIDIRNNLKHFSELEPCIVIEGFLHINLIGNKTDKDFAHLSFPKLREITGYFLLYRVDGLKSLRNMFPNLEVIRGDELLADYSFMIYEMQHLQEIGLNKLTKILRGGVRIENNPSLCYISTVNWTSIAPAGQNFFKDNKPKKIINGTAVDDCPGCSMCPGGHCWSAKHCQVEKKPCHPMCLGECLNETNNNRTGCFVCKNFLHEGQCVDQCPDGLNSYMTRRCVTDEKCQKFNENKRYSMTEEPPIWRPFHGQCVTRCPSEYQDAPINSTHSTCTRCKNHCHTFGSGAIIRHIADAQPFRGTTIVKGGLEFQLRNGNPNIINELTEAFGMVEEITGYLKVTHSFPITNLHFFKKLRLIKGDKLDITNASLLVLDNPNLSDLFPEGQDIKIQKGRLFFHYNPKLCYDKIVDLGRQVGIDKFTDVEVQPESNGEKVACRITELNLNVTERGSSYAKLRWDIYNPSTEQSLLSYLLHYVESENDIMSFEGNACGNNTWQIIDVEAKNSPDSMVSRVIKGLKPYTRYAVYVKTLLARTKNIISSKNSSNLLTGQSEIKYFRTQSDVPSVPTDVVSYAVSDTEIIVKWSPPEQPNGPIGYYLISGYIRLDDEKLPLYRNYCEYGVNKKTANEQATESTPVADFPTVTEILEFTKKPTVKDTMDCCHRETEIKSSAPKKFEIFCPSNHTISHYSIGKKNYCYNKYSMAESDLHGRVLNNTYYSFVFNVSMKTTYRLDKLRHYSLYTISVSACGHKLENGTEMCSMVQYTNTRTKERRIADNVKNIKYAVTNETNVEISWDSPTDPNSLTVAYKIEYTNILVKDSKARQGCVPHRNRQKRSNFYIKNLSPGKYSVRVRSMSLAGDGDLSEAVVFSIDMKENNTVVIVVLLTFGFLFVSLVVSYIVYRNHRKKKQQERLIASVNPDYIETKYIRDSWEVPRENIELLEELGLGNFGMVYRGILEGASQVAVKTIAENSGEREKNEFLNEASVMKNFSTFHIIRLMGVVSEGTPPYVIMELMENGDLKTYLRRIRDTHLVPDVSRIIRMAGEIADGMAYLESKKFVHRDLAARNCMVSKDLVCKIGDFGMARDIYETDYYKIGKKGLLPIRWMAPENLSDGVFTSDSDVWSYGVVLYEILTLAEIPYQGFSNEEVLNYVLRKGTVNIPRNCPEVILKIMEKCFKWRPSDRPTFMELVTELEPFLSQDFCEMSFYHSEEGVEIRSLGLKKVYHHAAPIRFHWGNETARWVREFEDNVTLLDQTKAGTSRGRIFKNGFQHFGNIATMEDVSLDR